MWNQFYKLYALYVKKKQNKTKKTPTVFDCLQLILFESV